MNATPEMTLEEFAKTYADQKVKVFDSDHTKILSDAFIVGHLQRIIRTEETSILLVLSGPALDYYKPTARTLDRINDLFNITFTSDIWLRPTRIRTLIPSSMNWIVLPESESSPQKDLNYPHICTNCGAAAYVGVVPTAVDCSNIKCKHHEYYTCFK